MDDLNIDLTFEELVHCKEEQKIITESQRVESQLTKISNNARIIICHKYDDDKAFYNDSSNLRNIRDCIIL